MEKHKSKIPFHTLEDILRVYELGIRGIESNPRIDYVASYSEDPREGLVIWTSWEEIFEIKDRIDEIKKKIKGV